MIHIKKGREPESLSKYKKQKYAYYDGCDKNDIRKHLLKDQGNLCAYCMRRITEENMKIEHWYPEDELSDIERLDFKNMLGCCEGHIHGTTGSDDTCDTHKKNIIIHINPLDANHIEKISYRSKSGEIYSDTSDFQNDINNTLNLNSEAHYLKANRKAALDGAINEMIKLKNSGKWNKAMVANMIERYSIPDVNGNIKEYAGIVIWYLNRKLK